jgi:membrane associated rhomboid family serine protease
MRAANKTSIVSAPYSVLFLFGLLIGAHALRMVLSSDLAVQSIVYGALFPARFLDVGAEGLPGGWLLGSVNLFSYNLLHGDWSHVLINAFWLLAFGTPIARRTGARGFVVLFFGASLVGGLSQVLASATSSFLIPIVGASAGVSGLMGAACRFAFSPQHRYAIWPARPRLLSTRETLQQPITLAFLGVWMGVNLLSGALAPFGFMTPDGASINVAWVAHLAGFIAGFYLLAIVDKPPLSPSGGPGRVDYGAWR